MRQSVRDVSGAVAALVVIAGVAVSPAHAADLDMVIPAPAYSTYGIACESAEARAFDSLWLGHFTGGDAAYTGTGGNVLLDWRDDKLCFPSRRSCEAWIAGMRHDFHRPRGYFTCLPIR